MRGGGPPETEVRSPRVRRGIYLLPNLLTTAGLLAGFYAIVATLDRRFVHAVGGVLFAAVMDGLDGRVARLTGTATPFGREYDSLSDMVAFGIAPALLVYGWAGASLPATSAISARALWLGAFFYAVAVALRLARFNTYQAHDRRYFQGLPSPSAALLVASAVWFEAEGRLATLAAGRLAVLALSLIAAALMVSRFVYPSFKEIHWHRRVRYSAVVLVPLVFIVVLLAPASTLLAASLLYALVGPAGSGWRRWRRGRRGAA